MRVAGSTRVLATLYVVCSLVLVLMLNSTWTVGGGSGPALVRAQHSAVHRANRQLESNTLGDVGGVVDENAAVELQDDEIIRDGGFDDIDNGDDADDADDVGDADDADGVDGVDGVDDADEEYEYVEVEDGDEDDGKGDHEEEKLAFGKLSSSDIASKDVFSARMQDVMSRREQSKKSKRAKVKVSTRYLAPERHGNAALSVEKTGVNHQSTFLEVTFLTIGMALSAGFGALPFFFVKKLSSAMNGLATAVACGVMFAASFDLIHEGQPYGAMMVILGIGLGAIFINFMQKYLDSLDDVSFGKLHGAKAKRLILVVGIMAAHAIGEGCGVGVSFVGDKGFDQGLLTTVAIGIHNIPEGMAKATVLVSQGATPVEALFWSVVTCLPQPLMAIPSFLFVNTFEFLLPVSLGFAAGCMIWMVFAELLPDALKNCDASQVASAATFSAAGLEGFRMLIESLDSTYGVGSNYGGYAPFKDTSLKNGEDFAGIFGNQLPNNIKLSFGLALGVVSIVTSWAPHMARIANATIPVVLGTVSVVMGLIGALPIARDLVVSQADTPRLHVMAAASIGVVGIVLLRNIILDQCHAMLIKRREKGDGFLGGSMNIGVSGNMATGNIASVAKSAMNNHRLPSKIHHHNGNRLTDSPHPPLRALSVILVVTSILHAMVCGAQLQRLGPAYGDFHHRSNASTGTLGDKSLSLAAAYGCLFGIVAGCSSFLWELTDSPSMLRSSIVASIISGACVLAHQAVVMPGMHHLILPYPRGILDTLSYVAHGALAMTALLTLAVGMTSQPRYTRFGVILAWVMLFGWGLTLWTMGTDVVSSVLSL